MRGRKLSQAEALEEYALYRIRVFEYLHVFQIIIDIMDGQYCPKDTMGHGRKQYIGTLKDSATGLFVSMMDRDKRAIDVFDVWLALFPQHEERIQAVWGEIEPLEGLLRDYRNKVACHVENDIGSYLRTRSALYEQRKEVAKAMQGFMGLARDLADVSSLPSFREGVEAKLKKEFPESNSVDRLVDYIVDAKPED